MSQIVRLELHQTYGITVPHVSPIRHHAVTAAGDCYYCGEPMMVLDNGVAHHLNGDDVDYDADANHVPILLEFVGL